MLLVTSTTKVGSYLRGAPAAPRQRQPVRTEGAGSVQSGDSLVALVAFVALPTSLPDGALRSVLKIWTFWRGKRTYGVAFGAFVALGALQHDL